MKRKIVFLFEMQIPVPTGSTSSEGMLHAASGAESSLKVGVYFNIFPNFLAISESGGATKSRPIDPFFDVIYLFLNVTFGQKVFKLTHFWMP